MGFRYQLDVFLRLIARVSHILSASLLFTVLILEHFFDLEKNYKLQEDQGY